MKLNEDIISRLSKQVQNKKLITGEYLTDEKNENFQYIKWKFFAWETVEKAKILNTGSWLFTAVSDVVSYYVWNPSLDLEFPTKKIVEDFESLAFACFWLQRINWKLEYTYLPADSYYSENWEDYIIRAYCTQKNITSKKYYYLRTSYIWGIIQNELFESTGGQISNNLNKVSLDAIEETKDLEEIVDTWLSKCFFLIKEDDLEENPISEIDKIKNIVYSIDRKIVMFDTQFLQNVESFVLLKWINLPTKILEMYNENGSINFSDLWRYITTELEWGIEFINNENSLIDKAISYEKTQTERISALTSIPLDFLGWTWTSGAIWEWSRELLHGSFIKKIESIRSLLDKYISESLQIINDDTGEEYIYSWNDIFSKNTNTLIEELEKALQNGIISKRTALKRYLNYSDDEVNNEFLEIENQNLVINEENNES